MEIEDLLKCKIQKFLNCKCNWEFADMQKFCGIDICERKNILVCENKKEYKYIECSKLKKSGKVCVGIGFNPAQSCSNEIDNTNVKIIKALLKQNYGKFILLNIYPLVSPSKAGFDESDKKSIIFAKECLPSLLETICNDTDADILIFWGRTANVESEVFEKLQNFLEFARLYMTVKTGESVHCHPAYVPIEIKEVSKDNLKSSYYVR